MTSIDQLGTQHQVDSPPQRIVSLVPSITELLCDLGAENRLVGCTKFCVHPTDLRQRIAVVGGTKNVHHGAVLDLQPDLIVASKEENVREQVDALRTCCPCWVSDVDTVAGAEALITELGKLLNCAPQAQHIVQANRHTLTALRKPPGSKAVYLIWRAPYMAAGGDTYISSMLEAIGYENLLASQQRYPSLPLSQLQEWSKAHAQRGEQLHILLSSEPYPFKDKHLNELSEACPDAAVRLVDGELYSWYGSRLSHLGAT